MPPVARPVYRRPHVLQMTCSRPETAKTNRIGRVTTRQYTYVRGACPRRERGRRLPNGYNARAHALAFITSVPFVRSVPVRRDPPVLAPGL